MKLTKTQWKRFYRVEAAIYSGIDDGLVWEGAFKVDARNKAEARRKARTALEQLVYFDDRIDPRGHVSPAEFLYEEERAAAGHEPDEAKP